MNPEASVKALLQQAEQLKIGSGYAAGWGNVSQTHQQDHEVYVGKASHAQDALPIQAHTFFDLASLTKIMATTSVVMLLTERGALDVCAPLPVYLPEECKRYPHLKDLTLTDLLTHTSGLPAWRAYYEELKTRFGSNLPYVSISQRKDFFYEQVLSTKPETQKGEKVIYSDVGFSVIGYLLEKYFARTVGELARDLVWSQIQSSAGHPLTLHYRPVQSDAAGAFDPKIAATEICPWRGWLQGQVHDDNAWSMGGVAAHAGVFGTLKDCVEWTRALIDAKWVSNKTLRQFFKEVPLANGQGSHRTLGFDMPSADGSGTTGFSFSQNSVGHLGFSGTSLWIDLDTGDYACLLTNRVHPSRNDLRIRPLRINYHQTVRF